MIIHDERYSLHLTGPHHPEQPLRIKVIGEALKAAGLLTPTNLLIPRLATFDELALCHSPRYIKLAADECSISTIDGSIYLSTGDAPICPASYEIACLAVGGVLTAVDAVMLGKTKSVFCNVRPPGHHACTSMGMGFCLFNNAAIGARYAQNIYGIKNVLIVDWDVHHGNGTQEILYDDPTVFYFSTHQYPLYPGTGAENERGVGLGKGTTLNVPIGPSANARTEVLNAFEILLPRAIADFKPELILISAGFDAHERDPLGGFNLTDADYASLTKTVMELAAKYAQSRVVSVLEGGYDLRALETATSAHVEALNM